MTVLWIYAREILSNDAFETMVVLECKHSKKLTDLSADCEKAAKQIAAQCYIEGLHSEGYIHVLGYGISFYKKKPYDKKVK